MEKQFRFFRLTDLEVKKDGLIICGGPQIADLENSLPDLPFQEGEHVLLPVHQKTGQEFPTTKKQR